MILFRLDITRTLALLLALLLGPLWGLGTAEAAACDIEILAAELALATEVGSGHDHGSTQHNHDHQHAAPDDHTHDHDDMAPQGGWDNDSSHCEKLLAAIECTRSVRLITAHGIVTSLGGPDVARPSAPPISPPPQRET